MANPPTSHARSGRIGLRLRAGLGLTERSSWDDVMFDDLLIDDNSKIVLLLLFAMETSAWFWVGKGLGLHAGCCFETHVESCACGLTLEMEDCLSISRR